MKPKAIWRFSPTAVLAALTVLGFVECGIAQDNRDYQRYKESIVRNLGILPYLNEPHQLGTTWPLPSVATGSPTFRQGEFWRGGTWINLNWVAIRGLQRYGFLREADALRDRTLELISLSPVLYELYDSQSGAPVGSPHYGWTSALYIDLVMRPDSELVPK